MAPRMPAQVLGVMNETDAPKSSDRETLPRQVGGTWCSAPERGLSRLVLVDVEELGAVVAAEHEREAREVGAQLVEVVALGASSKATVAASRKA
jgi:hypothetical protein